MIPEYKIINEELYFKLPCKFGDPFYEIYDKCLQCDEFRCIDRKFCRYKGYEIIERTFDENMKFNEITKFGVIYFTNKAEAEAVKKKWEEENL